MKWYEPQPEQLAIWQEFVDSRPDHVRAVAARFNPWTLYKLKPTGQRCSVLGFHEIDEAERARIAADGCGVSSAPVTVYIHAEHPALGAISARNVFGIDPDDLVEWTEADEPDRSMPSSFELDDFAGRVL